MKSRNREINPSGSASLCDERALTVLDGSRMAYDSIMGRAKYGRMASASPFFSLLFLKLGYIFFFFQRQKKIIVMVLKNPGMIVLECMIIGWLGVFTITCLCR